MARPIGTLGVIDTITVGGRVFTDVSTLKILNGFVATNNNSVLSDVSTATNGYIVPALKTFTIYALKAFHTGTSASSNQINILYADNNVANDSATAFTTPVYSAGSSVTAAIIGHFTTPTIETSFLFAIPTGKYPSMVRGGTGNIYIHAYGYEV
jgi:hypothetical protein